MASRKIGALWLRKTQDDKPFFTGVLQDIRGDIQIAVFKNDRKEAENQPDYNIVLSESRQQAERSEPKQEDADEVKVEDIPF